MNPILIAFASGFVSAVIGGLIALAIAYRNYTDR